MNNGEVLSWMQDKLEELLEEGFVLNRDDDDIVDIMERRGYEHFTSEAAQEANEDGIPEEWFDMASEVLEEHKKKGVPPMKHADARSQMLNTLLQMFDEEDYILFDDDRVVPELARRTKARFGPGPEGDVDWTDTASEVLEDERQCEEEEE